MADNQNEERGVGKPQSAVGGEAATSNPLMEQTAILFRWYVIECLKRDNPNLQISPEQLGGSPNEEQDPKIKVAVENMIKASEELNRNIEFQQLINQVQSNCVQEVFMTVVRNIFADGINWGRVLGLFILAYKLIYRSLITHDEEDIEMICNLFLQVFREHLYSWLVQQSGWVMVMPDFSCRRTVAMVACMVLVAGLILNEFIN